MNGKLEKFKPGKLFAITVLFLLIPLAYYIFFSVPEQKEQLSNHYLRLIARVSDQFETKGRNIKTVIKSEIENILAEYKEYNETREKRARARGRWGTTNDHRNDEKSPQNNKIFIHNSIEDKISRLKKSKTLCDLFDRITEEQDPIFEQFAAYSLVTIKNSLERIPDLDITCNKTREPAKNDSSQTNQSEPVIPADETQVEFNPRDMNYSLEIDFKPGLDLLEFIIFFGWDGQTFPYEIKAEIKINDYVEGIFKGEDFDEVFLLNENKKAIHQWGRSEAEGTKSNLRIFDFAPLIDAAVGNPGKKEDDSKKKNGDGDGDGAKDKTGGKKETGASGGFSQVLNIKAAGTDYKLFLQPIPLTFVSKEDKNWYVGGLLSAKTFALRSRKISLNAMIIFLFILLLVLVGYPTVKLLLTDAGDRLKTRDVFLVILSLSIGVPMVIYLFISTAYYFTGFNTTLKLKELAGQIHDNFSCEIDRAYNQLHILVEDKDRVMKSKIHDFGDEDIEKGKEILAAYENDRLEYPYFDMAFIMDETGKQSYKGVVNKDNISFNDVSSREYFKRIKKKEYWFTPSGKPMMLEPVYSKSTGRYEINIAIPLDESNSKDVFAAGMSCRPLSVINPVLPHGCAFAIIDHKGKVLFHSDSRLNSYENFFVESTAENALRAAIFARAECREKITYHGERWDLYSRPMENIPWDIIVLKNRDIGSAKGLASLLIAIMDNMIFIFFLGLLLICFDLYILFREKISGKAAGRQPIKFRLLWPTDQLRYKYNELALLNLLIFGILLLHLFFTENQPAYFLITPFIVSILIFSIMMKSIYYEGSRSTSKRPTRLSYMFSAIGLPIFVLGLIYLIEKDVFLSISFSNAIVLLPVAFYLIVLFIPKEKEKKWLKVKLFGQNSYTLFLCSYLLLAIAYPGLYMIKTTSQDISKTATKHDQLMLARNYSTWEKRVKKDYPGRVDFLKKEEIDITKAEPFKNPWTYTFQSDTLKIDLESHIGLARGVNSMFQLPVLSNFIDKEEQAKDVFSKIEGGINPAFFTVSILKFLNNMMPVNLHYVEGIMTILPEDTGEKPRQRPLIWTDGPDTGKIYFKYNEKSKRAKPIYIESTISKLKRDTKETIILTACIFFIVLFLTVILWVVVKLIIKIVFPPPTEISSHKKSLFYNSEETIPGKFLVLGKGAAVERVAPAAHDVTKRDSAQKKSSQENKISTNNSIEHENCIDCKDIESLKQFDERSLSRGEFVYLTHFDSGMRDAERNEEKLKLLERLVFSCDVNIIIFSNYEPLGYFTLTKPDAEDQGKKDKKNNDNSGKNSNKEEMSKRWQRIFNHFEYRYTREEEAREKLKAPAGIQGGLKEFVDNECAQSEYLGNVKNQIFAEFKGIKSENISLSMLKERVYHIARPVYDRMWRTSTAEEKLVLVQLAQEGLLNFKNKAPVRRLLNRGLIHYPPILFLSTTFKEYIKSADDLDKILRDEQIEEENRWKRFKRPFFYLVTLAVLFLVITQPNIMKSWMVIIPAFTAGVPAAIRFFDQFLGEKRYNIED